MLYVADPKGEFLACRELLKFTSFSALRGFLRMKCRCLM